MRSSRPVNRTRIDKWLWAARFFKTRGAATEAVLAGRVHLDGERVKPSKEVGIGDTLEIRVGVTRWTVVVTGIAERRGSADLAATLYSETPESVAARAQRALEERVARQSGSNTGARPTKRDRRRFDTLRRSAAEHDPEG